MERLRQLEYYRKDGVEQEINKLEYEINTQPQIFLRPDQLKLVQNRDVILAEMQQEIQIINEISNDLALMINEQSEQIDRIEDNISQAQSDVQISTNYIEPASKIKFKINEKKCIIITAVIVIVLIIILILVLSLVLSLRSGQNG